MTLSEALDRITSSYVVAENSGWAGGQVRKTFVIPEYDDWEPGRSYAVGDKVSVSDSRETYCFICIVAHTSSADFAADMGKWYGVDDDGYSVAVAGTTYVFSPVASSSGVSYECTGVEGTPLTIDTSLFTALVSDAWILRTLAVTGTVRIGLTYSGAATVFGYGRVWVKSGAWTVDWGDGTSEKPGGSTMPSHEYEDTTYTDDDGNVHVPTVSRTITVTGKFEGLYGSSDGEPLLFASGNCHIKSVEILSNLMSEIGDCTFTSYSADPDADPVSDLESVRISASSLRTIGDECFYGCSKLSSFTLTDSVVETVGTRCFSGCESLGTVAFPSSTYEFKSSAFEWCTSLKKVTAPGIRTLSQGCFSGCTSLTSIPGAADGSVLNYIGPSCFEGAGLTTVRIPASVTSISETSFVNCGRNLSSMYVDSGNEKYFGSDSIRYSDGGQIHMLAGFKGTNLLLSGVNVIDTYCFYGCTGLDSIVFPATVTSVGLMSFAGCSGVDTIRVERTGSVLPVPRSAFTGVPRTARVDVDVRLVTSYLEDSTWRMFTNYASIIFRYHRLDTATGEETVTSHPATISYASRTGLSNEWIVDYGDGTVDYGTGTTIPSHEYSDSQDVYTVVLQGPIESVSGSYDDDYAPLSPCTDYTGEGDPPGANEIVFATSYVRTLGYDFFDYLFLQPGRYDAYRPTVSVPPVRVHGSYMDGYITFPDTVTELGDCCFWGCIMRSLPLYVPKSCTSMGGSCFCQTDSDSTIVFAGAVTEFDNDCFSSAAFDHLSFPSSTTYFGIDCFYEATFRYLEFGRNVTMFEEYCFSGTTLAEHRLVIRARTPPDVSYGAFNDFNCPSTTLYVPRDVVDTYRETEGWSGFFAYEGAPAVTFGVETSESPEAVPLTGAVSSDGTWTLSTDDEDVDMTGDAVLDRDVEFGDPVGDHYIDITGQVTSVAPMGRSGEVGNVDGFVQGDRLRSLFVALDSVVGLGANMCCNNTGLETVQLSGSSLKTLGSFCFSGCGSLSDLTLTSPVVEMGTYCFNECVKLPSIVIPDTVTTLGKYCFRRCTGATSAIAVPSSVTSVPDGCFMSCRKASSISAPGAVDVAADAFYLCRGATSVSIPKVEVLSGRNAFHGCSSMTSLTITSLKKIAADGVFSGCTALKTLDAPALEELTGKESFSGCTSLASISAPSLKTIGKSSFDGCTALKSLDLKVASFIGEGAFNGCTSVKAIVMRNTDDYIRFGIKSFAGCTGLSYIKLYTDTVPGVYSNTFDTPSNITLTVPYASIEKYKRAAVWKEMLIRGKVTIKLTYVVPRAGARFGIGYRTGTSYGSLNIVAAVGVYAYGSFTIDYGDGSEIVECNPGKTEDATVDLPSSSHTFSSTGTYEMTLEGDIFGLSTSITSQDTTYANRFGGYPSSSKNAGVAVTGVTLPEGLVSLDGGMSCFGYLSSDLTLPSTLRETGHSCFVCSTFETVKIPQSSALVTLAYRSFLYCKSLVSVDDLLNAVSLQSIGLECFQGCSKLSSIGIPVSVTSIGDSCFSGCSALTAVDFRASKLTYLPSSCFSSCSSLTAFDTSKSSGVALDSIGSNCFSGCSSLTSLGFLPTVKTYGNACFQGCTSLTSLDFGSSVLTLGDHCFDGCSSLTSLNVPSPISSIGSYCFKGCSSVTSLVLPPTLKTIGDYCFSGCPSIPSVVLPSSLETLGKYCFDGCSLITSLVIPASVSSIGSSCFNGCTGLTTLYFSSPSLLTSISSDVFTGCNSLNTISFPAPSTSLSLSASCFSGNTSLSTVTFAGSGGTVTIGSNCFDGCTGLSTLRFNSGAVVCLGNYCFRGCTSLGIVDMRSVNASETTGGYCFMNSGVKKFYFPSSVRTVGNGFFYGCSSLTDIIFPDDSVLENISNNFVVGCLSLKHLEIPASVSSVDTNPWDGAPLEEIVFRNHSKVTVLGSCHRCSSTLSSIILPSSLETISSSCFKDCSLLKTLDIPGTVTSFGTGWASGAGFVTVVFHEPLSSLPDSCLSGLTSLTSVTLPSSLVSIGASCFSGCTSLPSISMPSGVTSLPSSCFYKCSSLTNIGEIISSMTSLGESCFEGCVSFKGELTIPSAITLLPASCFRDCSSLTSVVIPETVKSIGERCFQGTGLVSIDLSMLTVESIGDRCFMDCSSLSSIVFPSTVTSLGYGCFVRTGFTSIVIPDYVVTIGDGCFGECSNLVSVEIPDSVTSLGKQCFAFDGKLVSVRLSSSLTILDNYMFYECGSLSKIDIPAAVTKVRFGCFYQCTSLSAVICRNPEPPTIYDDSRLGGTFDGTPSDKVLYVPADSIETYQAGTWATYFTDIRAIEEM